MDDFLTYFTQIHLFFKFLPVCKFKQEYVTSYHNESWTRVEYDDRTSL